jgi:PAS domain S-box-containing protein
VIIQVTETAQFHEKTLAMNEALMLGSLRQHELTEVADSLNVRLQSEITARNLVEAEQKKLDQRLRDQQFYTRSLIESNIDALMTTDPSGIITDVNKQMEALTGCTRDELIGAPFKSYFTDPERAEAAIKLVLREKKVTDYELTACARDGRQTEVSYNATTFYDRARTLQGVFAAARDVTDRKQRERDALSLTNEISHRIKNNLQVIVGLIAYEAKWTAAPCVQGYKAMQARIGAIAQLYDLISQSSRGRTIAVDAYLREIAKTMSASLLGNISGIDIEVKGEPLEIDPDRAVPFGLLVNELATNAIKHAFPHGTGHIMLCVEQVGDQIELVVSDDGVGMKDKGSAKVPEKRGSDYLTIFVRQLGGTIIPSIQEPTGTTVRIRLPLLLVPPGGADRTAA